MLSSSINSLNISVAFPSLKSISSQKSPPHSIHISSYLPSLLFTGGLKGFQLLKSNIYSSNLQTKFQMSILNHCATSGGQPGFPLKGTGIQESNQHHPKSLPLHGTHAKKLLQPNSTINRTSPTMTIGEAAASLPDASFMCKNDYSKHSMELETLFMGPFTQFENEKISSTATKEAVAMETYQVLGEKNFVLAVSVSSALKLDERQVSLIAKKMKRLTGFKNLKLENTIDPSLIAGFVISYGDDGSNIIDLSVKGQLANLASRVESFDKWNPSYNER